MVRKGLTSDEERILGYIVMGLSNLEIADRLGLSQYTIRNHNVRTFEKLGVKNRTQAAVTWVKELIRRNGDVRA